MEAEAWPTALALSQRDEELLEQLKVQFKRHSFFQLVWMVHRMFPDAPPIGGAGPFSAEPIRFRANASMGFPISDVSALVEDGKFNEKLLFTVNFLGIYGPSSPIPVHYTEDIVQNDPEHNAIRHFLDLFNHRLISLVYRAWEKYRYFFIYREGGEDYFSNWMFSLFGVGHEQLRRFSSIKWSRLLPFMELLSLRCKSGKSIATVLSAYFDGVDVSIQECIGKMVTIDDTQRNRLGVMNITLGESGLLGGRIFDRTSTFQVTIGPLDFQHYRHHLPQGRYHRALRELVQFMMNDQLAFDVVLILKGGQIPQLSVGRNNQCQLGCSAWLGERLVEHMVIRQVGIS